MLGGHFLINPSPKHTHTQTMHTQPHAHRVMQIELFTNVLAVYIKSEATLNEGQKWHFGSIIYTICRLSLKCPSDETPLRCRDTFGSVPSLDNYC